MSFSSQHLSCRQTGLFSTIVNDYLDGADKLRPFFTHPVREDGIRTAIAERKKYPTDRSLLSATWEKQYAGLELSEKQRINLSRIKEEDCFTVTTAHQPNIFTGHLYFIYKILHAVKLAETLSLDIPGSHFVPVYYMGSEDADLEELGHIYLSGEKYSWNTRQTGAVGRMTVDDELITLIDVISGQLSIQPHGDELVGLLRSSYQKGRTIEQATFHLVNTLFAAYGLMILLPDDQALKKAFIPVAEKELLTNFSHQAVAATMSDFPAEYKVQAGGREINLFYLNEDSRERIVLENSIFNIQHSAFAFNESALKEELHKHPERFSPNVILRPVFQEMILPNVAFIGGGGELAYWLELKKVFESVDVPFPVLVLRNSFLVVEETNRVLTEKLGLTTEALFKSENELMNRIVKRESAVKIDLAEEKKILEQFYMGLGKSAGLADKNLETHTRALYAQALKKIDALEKKIIRAEKKKLEVQQRQVQKLRAGLFPRGILQERVDNLLPYYAQWGSGFLELIHTHSLGLEQQFTVITEE
ncbi:MAG: bacillithiol biosynthesis cysteine-adding enzyme BshC [Chitinophagaceae bacterium]|nr:bacillithiol biosynthesis cysteine-adding enzyme BshC [Chitinophagaceae bacterium]